MNRKYEVCEKREKKREIETVETELKQKQNDCR